MLTLLNLNFGIIHKYLSFFLKNFIFKITLIH